VQGQLRQEKLSISIQTECGHCHKPLNLEIDSELNCKVQEPEAAPLVFVPMVNFQKLDDPSIIDAF
jgi:hypothetical protein